VCVNPCVTCYNNPTTCMSCTSGFTLVKNLCISNFNFKFSVTFSVASNSAFLSNYDTFLLQMANSINSTVRSIAISSINYTTLITSSEKPIVTSGNIFPSTKAQQNQATVSGMISTTATVNSADSYNQFQALQSFLFNPTIVGMAASNPLLGVNGGTIDNSNSSSSNNNNSDSSSSSGVPLLILAIAIPIVVLSIYTITKSPSS